MCSPGQSPREQVLADLASTDATGLPPAALMERAAELAGFIGQLQGELARFSAALDTAGPQDHGHASAAAFLRTGCALAPGRASELVAAGRGLSQLPATCKALAAGEISFDQALVTVRTATAITAAVTAPNAVLPGPADPAQQAAAHATAEAAERVLLDAAAGGVTTTQLRQLGEEIAYRAAPDAAEERQRRRWDQRYLSFGLTLDDTGTISGACGDTLTYETIRTAAETFSPPGGTLDTRTPAQRRLDGLAAACRTALDTGTAPHRHSAAPHISVLVHDETLAQATAGQPPGADQAARHGASGDAGTGTSGGTEVTGGTVVSDGAGASGARTGAPPGRTGHGAMLTATQVLALCCSAEVTAIRWDNGLPLNVGRASRTEPPALRKALEARDRTCRWPGCQTPATWATAHHIHGWAHGAATSLTQMILLCHLHHAHFIHQLGWTITGNPNATIHFTNPATGLTLDSPLPGKARAP